MLTEADYGLTEMAHNHGQQGVGDENLLVRFSTRPWHDAEASRKAGRPIYKDREYIEIIVPGNKDNIVHRPASRQDIARFPRHYAAFQQNKSQEEVEGTPLSLVNFVSPAQAEELRHFHIHTVEQLANMSDSNAQNFMGIQRLKTHAKAFLEVSSIGAESEEIMRELESRDAEIKALKEANQALNARLDKLEAKS